MKYVKRVFWGIVAIVMIWCIGMSAAPGKTNKNIDISAMSASGKSLSETERGIHITDTSNLEKVAADGVIELYFDRTSYSVSVYETTSGQFWHSLPVQPNTASDAAVLSLEIERDGVHYELNSQDDSIAYGNIGYSLIEENDVPVGIKVNYVLSIDEPDGAENDSAYEVSVNYQLKDGSLIVSADCSKLENDENSHVISMNLLEYFGSMSENESEGFILVPDGSGAIIDLSYKPDSFDEVILPVYGSNLTVDNEKEQTGQAIFPIFGVKRSKGAFVAIIQNGDALSEIHADRSVNCGVDKVYSKFTITDSAVYENMGTDEAAEYFSSEAYDGNVKICYRFLSESNANFTGMSISCREQLIRDGLLSTKTVSESDYLPMNLTVIGTADRYIDSFRINTVNTKVLTSFEEAIDMVSQLKAKGINSLNLRYVGMFTGGTNQDILSRVKLNTDLGGKREYEELCDYLDGLKMSLFADVNILSVASDNIEKDSNAAVSILSESGLYYLENSVGSVIDYVPELYSRKLLSPNILESSIDRFIKNTADISVDGICINDAGNILYSDFGDNYINREEAKSIISQSAVTLMNNRNKMVSVGNMYMMKQADFIVDMPVASERIETEEGYDGVPFIQMIIHGTIEYSLTSINSSSNYESEMLKCIEYGALPSFEWIYSSDGNQSQYYYSEWLTRAADFYARANETLYDLRSVRIVDNYYAADTDVKCTEYENGAVIYVNYSSVDQVVDEVTVPAMDFVRIG